MPGRLCLCLLLTFPFLILKPQVRAVGGQEHTAWSDSPVGNIPAGFVFTSGAGWREGLWGHLHNSVRGLWVWRFWWGWGSAMSWPRGVR